MIPANRFLMEEEEEHREDKKIWSNRITDHGKIGKKFGYHIIRILAIN